MELLLGIGAITMMLVGGWLLIAYLRKVSLTMALPAKSTNGANPVETFIEEMSQLMFNELPDAFKDTFPIEQIREKVTQWVQAAQVLGYAITKIPVDA